MAEWPGIQEWATKAGKQAYEYAEQMVKEECGLTIKELGQVAKLIGDPNKQISMPDCAHCDRRVLCMHMYQATVLRELDKFLSCLHFTNEQAIQQMSPVYRPLRLQDTGLKIAVLCTKFESEDETTYDAETE